MIISVNSTNVFLFYICTLCRHLSRLLMQMNETSKRKCQLEVIKETKHSLLGDAPESGV